jgi:threonine/homoserine efflux transporter RhtA
VIVFFASWVILHLIFRGKNMNFARATTIALILLGLGLLGTFPPFFEAFAGE